MLSKYVGEGEMKLRRLFADVRCSTFANNSQHDIYYQPSLYICLCVNSVRLTTNFLVPEDFFISSKARSSINLAKLYLISLLRQPHYSQNINFVIKITVHSYTRCDVNTEWLLHV